MIVAGLGFKIFVGIPLVLVLIGFVLGSIRKERRRSKGQS